MTENLPEPETELDQHYFVALAMLLHKRGGSFSYNETDYEIFKVQQAGSVQIIVSQHGPVVRLDLMKENRGPAN